MRLAVICLLGCVTVVVTPRAVQAQVLDRIEIIESSPASAEIHIIFNTRTLYLRHTPAEKGDLIRIFLDFPDIDRSRRFSRELASSPPSDLVPKFTVAFPDQATNGLSVRFEKPVRFKVTQRDIRGASRIVITVKVENLPLSPKPPVVKEPTPPSLKGPKQTFAIPPFKPGSDVETYAAELKRLGDAALAAQAYEQAITIFNSLLNLPPNKQSQEAQELVGLARERSGEIHKAKAEYELYLRLYQTGEGAERVRQRLAALAEMKAEAALQQGEEKRRPIDEFQFYGSVYEYYYGGFSQASITDKTTNTATTLKNHDQSLLQSAFDVTGRYRKGEYDTRAVARGTHMYDTLALDDTRRSIYRLRAFYLEHSKKDSYFLRVGRQPGNVGGILDFRFDGAWFRYTTIPQLLNLNIVGGLPRQFSLQTAYVPDDPRNLVVGFNRYFYGINVDVGLLAQSWSGNAYFINQMVNGIVDRRAIGAELRYSSNGKNAFGFLDYDVSYNVLNVAMASGTWVTEHNTFTLLVDHRRTPYLQTTNALFGTPNASLSLINETNESLLREQAKTVTATSNLFLVGMLHTLNKNWQVGGDVRLNRISGTSASNCLIVLPGTNTLFINPNAQTDALCSLQAIPGTGNIWTVTGQAIGTDVPFEQSTLVLNASYIDNNAYKGQSATFNSLTRIGSDLQLNTFLIFYHQKDSLDVHLYRITPTLRVDYRLYNGWTIEGSGGIEQTFSTGPLQKDSTTREFFFFGLRWDFS